MKSFLAPVSVFFVAWTLSGCVTQEIVRGTSSYESSPPSAALAGASPQTALLCENPQRMMFLLSLGDTCTLALKDRKMSRGGTEWNRAESIGTCVLAGADGPLPLRITTATAILTQGSFDVTLGGTTTTGDRYVTYRFTGPRHGAQADGACEAVRRFVASSASCVDSADDVGRKVAVDLGEPPIRASFGAARPLL
jgi:hypothetical protein